MTALFDENGYPTKEGFERRWRDFIAEQRARFFEYYAPEINEREASFWKFPYTAASPALMAYEQTRFENVETWAAIEDETWNKFTEAHENVKDHFERVFAAIEDDSFTDDNGNRPLKVGDGIIDITPIAMAVAEEGFDRIDLFGDISFRNGTEISDLDFYSLRKGKWTVRYRNEEPIEEEGYYLEYSEEYTVLDDEGEEITELGTVSIPYSNESEFTHFGFMYLTMYALVARLGCGKSVRALAYPAKRERTKTNLKTDTVRMPNDAVHKALLDRPEDTAIEARQYFEPDSKAIEIPTGGGGYATVTIINDLPFDAAMEAYRLSPVDRFYYEAVCSLAYEGMGVIRGSQLLTFNGWKNPYQESARKTMERALNSIAKMSRIRVGIDTTKEKKKRYRNLAESYGFRPVIDCNYDIMRFDDGTLDFEITLNTTNDGTPFGALPLAVYSLDKRQLISARREEMEFETLKRLEEDQRMMWRYVMRRMREKKTSETIVFDTIFKNLEQPDLIHPAQNRQKRARMLTTLHKMLEERQSQGVLTFTWNRNKNGQFEYSVTIKLTKTD